MSNQELDIEVEESVEQNILLDKTYMIVIYNDDFNTFDFVIDCLIKLCNHNPIQAEQCTMLIHYKGKCEVKQGAFKQLKPIHQAFLDRGLTSKIQIKN